MLTQKDAILFKIVRTCAMTPKAAILFKIVHTCAIECLILKYKYVQNPCPESLVKGTDLNIHHVNKNMAASSATAANSSSNSVAGIFESMEYGPNPETPGAAQVGFLIRNELDLTTSMELGRLYSTPEAVNNSGNNY